MFCRQRSQRNKTVKILSYEGKLYNISIIGLHFRRNVRIGDAISGNISRGYISRGYTSGGDVQRVLHRNISGWNPLYGTTVQLTFVLTVDHFQDPHVHKTNSRRHRNFPHTDTHAIHHIDLHNTSLSHGAI